MVRHEWPLIIFTLSLQISAGLTVLYNLFMLFPAALRKDKVPFRFNLVLLLSSFLALSGILASFLHLGNPRSAMWSLSNLNDSWLSKEILTVLVYSALLYSGTFLQIRFPKGIRYHKIITDLASIAGIILVYAMSRVYMIPTMPAWNSVFTPIGFLLAMLLVAVGILVLVQLREGSWACLKGLTALTVILPAAGLAVLPFHMGWLDEASEVTRKSLEIILDGYMAMFYAKLALLVLTFLFGLWAFFSVRSDTTKKRHLLLPAILALIASIGAILLDRILFYAQAVPLMPV